MQIAARLKINMWISLAAVLLMTISLSWSFWEIYRTNRTADLLKEIRKAASDRVFLRDDYLLHREERAATQWQAKSESLRQLLDRASGRFSDSEDKNLLREAHMNFEATFSGFSRFLEQDKRDKGRLKSASAVNEAETRLISQVFLKAYALQDSIDRLSELSEIKANTAWKRGVALLVFFIVGGGLAIVVNSIVIDKVIAKRLATLQAGIEVIGSGHLDYRIDAPGDDELSALALAGNDMAARLKASYISVENLEAEIKKRQEAEEKIRRLNEELEERVRERTAELEVSNRQLEAFSYSVSHDLRAPLRSIDGFSQVLLEDYAEKPLDEVGKDYLGRVRKAAQHMGRLIDDLLKLARVSKFTPRHDAVDLSRMVRTLVEVLREKDPERTVAAVVQEGIVVQGDADLLRIALQNLLDNAWKFTGRAVNPRIEFGTSVQDGSTAYFIRDNGEGFDMAYVKKLFGAFQRLHAPDEFAGTGIGLATVKRIINRHGGHIWAEGEVGKGATFFFTIP